MADGEGTTGTTGQDPNPGGNQGGDGGQGPATFTQDQVNVVAGQARKEARERLLKEMADKYGDLEALKALAEKQQQAEEAAKSEAQKLADAAAAEKAKLEKKLADAEAEREAMNARLVEQVLRSAVMREATAAGADPDVAWAMIDREQLSLDEKGDAAGVKTALEALKKAKPHLFGGSVPGSPSNRAGGAGGGASMEAAAKKVREELAKRGGRYRM
jgi:membrane protein involved in colicin uptake